MKLKNIAGICGAILAALFLCPTARADQNFVDFDDYLVAAPILSSGSLKTGNGTVYQVSTGTAGQIVYFRSDGASFISATTQVSSDTIASRTFTDGSAATGTFTVASYTALSTAAATGQYTVLSTATLLGVAGVGVVVIGSTQADAQVAVNALNGPDLYIFGGTVAEGGASSATAANFATAVNVSSWTSGVTASQTGTNAYVTLTCINAGTACNSFSVTSSSPAEVSTAAFSGGVDPSSITFNTGVYIAGVQFQVGADTTGTARNIAAAFNTYVGSNTTSNLVISTNAANIVYSTATITGTVPNGYGMTSYTSSITVSGATMTGGQNNAQACINGICVTANAATNGFAAVTSNNQTATNIAAAFNASASSQIVTAQASAAVVTATATAVGTGGNYALTSSSNPALTVALFVSSNSLGGNTVGTMTNGTNAAWTLVSGTATVITISTHGFNTGLQVLYTTAKAVTGLSTGTTYYVIYLSPNTMSLALTSTGAVAGLAINLTSSSTQTTADTYTLAPLASTGTPSFQWVVTDDPAIGWTPMFFNVTVATGTFTLPVSSVTLGSYTAGGQVNYWDFGHIDWPWFGINIIPPSAGAVKFGAHVIGKTQ